MVAAVSRGVLGRPQQTRAAGFDAAPIGARDGGRGGASLAGSDSALGLFYNPATLLATPGFVDGVVALHAHVGELCFSRVAVTEDEDGTRSGGERSPEVCTAEGPGDDQLVNAGSFSQRLDAVTMELSARY